MEIETNPTSAEELKDQKDQKGEEETPPENVELSPEQYDWVLEQLGELEQLRKSGVRVPVDDLAREGTRRTEHKEEPKGPGKDYNDMTNQELVTYIVDEVNRQLQDQAMPIVRDVEELKLMNEILRCENKYDDFWEYQKEIHQLGSQNPHLSIEQAYLIASGKKAKTAKESNEKGDKKGPKVLPGLPPRPKTYGEKPSGSVPKGSVSKPEPTTIKDAANLAWDKVIGNEKDHV